jgi:hypothetical protein
MRSDIKLNDITFKFKVLFQRSDGGWPAKSLRNRRGVAHPNFDLKSLSRLLLIHLFS